MDTNEAAFWDGHYEAGRTGWDLGRPTPVFERLARDQTIKPGRLIVLGAGRGYDARMFAAAGFSVMAVDFSAAAAAEMRRLASAEAPVEIHQADIFELLPEFAGQFDYVLEYTCFCAIDPARRSDYADLIPGLLKSHGRYIALAFPIGTRPGGPPFVVQPDALIDLLTARGMVLQQREMPSDSVPGRQGVEELVILAK